MSRFMNKNEIKEVIRCYISNKEDELSIFINGNWGTGKTYFIEHEIIPEIKIMRKKSVLVSLYNVKDIDSVYVDIYLRMMGQYIPKRLNKQLVKKCGETMSNILCSVQPQNIELGNETVKAGIGIPTINDIVKIVNTWSNIEDYVIIFDDFERCGIPPQKMLGFINEFLIQKKCKCIIVGNEDEINRLRGQENLELKYLVALNEKLLLDTENKKGAKETNDIKQFELEQLKQRTAQLFAENVEYNIMKEKVVGRTIYFKQNLEEIIDNLANKEEYEMIKNSILSNKERIIEILNLKKHNNIRTIIFAFNEFKRIFLIINGLDVPKDVYYNKAVEDVLANIIFTSIENKTLNKKCNSQNKYEYQAVSFGVKGYYSIVVFEFINKLIATGAVDGHDIKETLKKYIEELKLQAKDIKDPFNKLMNYWDMEDIEILNNIKELKLRLKREEYLISYYPRLISIMVKITMIGFNEEALNEIIEIMKNNIEHASEKQLEGNEFVKYGLIHESNEENVMFEKYMTPLRECLRNKMSSVKQTEINEIFESENGWGEKLENYQMIKETEILSSRKFLKDFNIKRILNLIIKSKTIEISSFRRTINSVYSFSNIKEYYIEDLTSLVELKEGIDKILEQHGNEIGITKKRNLEYLDVDLINIINLLK